MKKLFRVLCIGLLVIVCSISLLLCACGDPNSNTENPNPGIVTPPNPDDNPPNPDDNPPNPDDNPPKPDDNPPKPDDDPPKPDDNPPKPPEKETFTVTFDMNGYGIAIASKSAKEGETIEAPEAPSVLFMTFGGWYKNAACTEAFDFDAPLTANVTAYAKWTPSEEMPETGYSPDAPKNVILDGVSVSDDIASGTTLYYTFTATAAGRYGFSIASNGDVAKLDYVYTASSSTAEELKENAGLVNGEYNFYLTLAAEETVSISVVVKEGETISAENPSDARVSAFTVTDEPLPDGIFLEGLYKGNYANYMTIYFRIKDRVNKLFTLNADSEGTKEGVFTYLDGVVTIAQGQSDWVLGYGTMTWEAPEYDDEPGTINFTGPSSMGEYRNFMFVQDIEPISLAHEQWIGEYEATKDDAAISTVRIGKKYVQIVYSDGTMGTYFTEIGTVYANYAKFTNTEITCGGAGTIFIKSENDGHADKIKVAIGSTNERLVLKNIQVKEIPSLLPLVNGATYTGTVTVDEDEKSYELFRDGNFWVIKGLVSENANIIEILDFDGESTYSTKISNNISTSSVTKYYDFKLVRKEGKLTAEVYEGETLIVTLTTNAADVTANTYALKNGENTGSVDAETGYAYITVEETRSYIFTGDVKIYKGVNVLSPGNDSAWTELPLGEMVDLTEGIVLAVKPTEEGSSFTFSAQFKSLRGTAEDNPIEIESSYTFSAQKDTTYFLKFVAPADGDFSFKSGSVWNYVGFCIENEWYANTADGATVLDRNNLFEKTLAEGETLIIKVANVSYKNSGAVSFTLNVTVTYDFSEGTALTLDEDVSGTVGESGVYTADITKEGVTDLNFNADATFKIILSNGTVKNGKSINLTVAQLQSGFKLVCSGEVSYTAVWNPGYEKNPYTLTMSSSGSTYTWRDVEGNGTYFTFTAPKTENYSFRFATEGGYFIYNDVQSAALTLELTEGQEITFRANKESGVTSTTFSLLLGYNYFENATEISFAADQSETALTAGNHKVTAGTLENAAQITFTSQSSFKILYTNGNEAESTQADDVYTLTLLISQMTVDTVFKLEAESEVSWKVGYIVGTVKNPAKPTINALTTVATTSNAVRYVTVTAPDYAALNISVGQYSFRYNGAWTYYMFPTFTIDGDESETKYGYANNGYTTNKNTIPAAAAGGRSYTLAKGETVTLKVQYLSPLDYFVPYLNGYNVTVYFSFADNNTTALDWTAESKTLSSSDVKVYKNANAEIASFKLTADKAFAVYHGASATSNPTRVAATLTDNVYTVTVTNRYFFLDYGENTEITYAAATYSVGTSNNPLTTSSLGNTNISYTSAYTDGKYYVTVTVAEAGNYILGVASGYTITGEGLTDGVVVFTAEALSKTFTVVSNSYTTDGDTITATVAVSLLKKLEAEALTFNDAVGSEGVGTLTLVSGNAYKAGETVISAANDKHIASITFKSAETFKLTYADGTEATAKAGTEEYTVTITVVNAKAGFTLTSTAEVTYVIDWAAGSYLNPVEFNAVNSSGTNFSYPNDNVAHITVKNDSEHDWLVSVSGDNYTLVVQGGSATGNSVVVTAKTTATLVITNGASDATTVATKVVIINNFLANATELAFDADNKGTTTVTSGNSYKYSGQLDNDVEGVVFKSESTIKVTYTDDYDESGNEILVLVDDLRNGFYIECDGEMTYEIAWFAGSSRNPAVLEIKTQTVKYRRDNDFYAEFTATEAGYYAFQIGTANYFFTLGDDATHITKVKEVELAAGEKVVIKIGATTQPTAATANVSFTITYSETSRYGEFPAAMQGTWTFKGTVKDYWGDNVKNVSATLVFGEGRSVTYTITGSGWDFNNSPLELEPQADGSMRATYKLGVNTRYVYVWFEDGKVYFKDTYNANSKYEMTKAEA